VPNCEPVWFANDVDVRIVRFSLSLKRIPPIRRLNFVLSSVTPLHLIYILYIRGHFEVECAGTPFPWLQCLRTHYGGQSESFSNQKCRRLQYFAYTVSEFPAGVTNPGSLQKRPGVWAQTPISARLASVPVVHVVRNDH